MKILRLVLTFALLSPIFVNAQQAWSSHKAVDLDDVFVQWDSVTKEYQAGVSIMRPPQKLKFNTKYIAHPQPCNTGALQIIMSTFGIGDFLKRAPTSQCVKISSDSGREVTAWVQDVLVPGFIADAKLGKKIKVYVDFLAYDVQSDKSRSTPLMFVGRFEPDKE